MLVVKVSHVRSFALFYELAVKVTRILPVDLVGVNGESKGCHLHSFRRKATAAFEVQSPSGSQSERLEGDSYSPERLCLCGLAQRVQVSLDPTISVDQ